MTGVEARGWGREGETHCSQSAGLHQRSLGSDVNGTFFWWEESLFLTVPTCHWETPGDERDNSVLALAVHTNQQHPACWEAFQSRQGKKKIHFIT